MWKYQSLNPEKCENIETIWLLDITDRGKVQKSFIYKFLPNKIFLCTTQVEKSIFCFFFQRTLNYFETMKSHEMSKNAMDDWTKHVSATFIQNAIGTLS